MVSALEVNLSGRTIGNTFSQRLEKRRIDYAFLFVSDTLAMKLSYGDATDLYRINLGWAHQRGGQAPGFVLDLERGYWSSNPADDQDDADAPVQGRLQRVVPYVKDTKNALVMRFEPPRSGAEMASLQAAFLHEFGVGASGINYSSSPSAGTLIGSYSTSASLIGVGLNLRF